MGLGFRCWSRGLQPDVTGGWLREYCGLGPFDVSAQICKVSSWTPVLSDCGSCGEPPLPTGVSGAVITCFSLRDVVSLASSLDEFARVTRHGGGLAVVDIGKPDSGLSRALIGFYISHVMPVLARFSIRGRTVGNPFKMIIPTWKKLQTNKLLSNLIEQSFGPCALKSFLLGGLVVFEADRFSVWKDIL